ncbi:unnamed protein product, partial [Iphiclides podalirius]
MAFSSKASIQDPPLKMTIAPNGQSRPPLSKSSPEIIEKIVKIVLEDAQLEKKQLASMVRVYETTFSTIVHDNFGMTKISTRWVPRMLRPLQKRERVVGSVERIQKKLLPGSLLEMILGVKTGVGAVA